MASPAHSNRPRQVQARARKSVRTPKRRAAKPESQALERAPQVTAISAAVFLTLGFARHGLALPNGEQIAGGQVSVQRPTATSMVINQATSKAVVNWQGFSIGSNESVNIHQPTSTAVLLNRVYGGDASQIQGHLTANGQVFLLNPNGLTYGPDARVTVGGMVASTLALSDKDFYSGKYQFNGTGKSANVLVQPGAIVTAHDRGYVALLGGEVSNQGTLSAKLGTVLAAAGDSVTLDFAGDGLTKIKIDKAALQAAVANNGAMIADGGQVILTASSGVELARSVVNQSGVIRAQSLLERNGRIILASEGPGEVSVSGTIDASAPAAGTTGGTVHITGERVAIVDHGSIDASGAAGGGEILVGGGLHGQNAQVRNAGATFVGSNTALRADALLSGNGGTIAVWSDGPTRAHGTISARGGSTAGNGGLIETSGKQLDTSGIRVDASARNGRAGTWLLDPLDLTI